MNGLQINNLLQVGAQQKVRQNLKKLSLRDRLPVLHECIPYVSATSTTLKFFQENFAQEIGALISANYDYEKAELLYNVAKRMK